jgi:hypothetical protein
MTTNGNSMAAKRLENCPAGQREHVVTPNSEYGPATQFLQPVSGWVSSFSNVPYVPAGQLPQDVSFENGFKLGCAMNVPGEQHPKRPVDVKPLFEDKVCHWPPHKVRPKPLDLNTWRRNKLTERVRNVIG